MKILKKDVFLLSQVTDWYLSFYERTLAIKNLDSKSYLVNWKVRRVVGKNVWEKIDTNGNLQQTNEFWMDYSVNGVASTGMHRIIKLIRISFCSINSL